MVERILITGGAGFIGYHLAKHLSAAGYRICLADNHLRGIYDRDLGELLSQTDTSFVELDLLDRDAVLNLGSEFNVIYHLAAIIGVRHVLEKPYDVLTQNTRMLDNVIKLGGRQKHLSRLFFASTSEVYAGTLKHFSLPIPTPEKTPLATTDLAEPRTSYMLSKIMGEAMIQNSNLPFTIFRPHNIYGPRMGLAHVIPEQLERVFKAGAGDRIKVVSPAHTRTFCYVDDAVEMLRRMLINSACQGRTLNLGTEAPEVSIRQLVRICIEVSGKKLDIVEYPPTPGSPARRSPDMRETKEMLRFQSWIILQQGIEKTWAWYRDNIFAPGGNSAR